MEFMVIALVVGAILAIGTFYNDKLNLPATGEYVGSGEIMMLSEDTTTDPMYSWSPDNVFYEDINAV